MKFIFLIIFLSFTIYSQTKTGTIKGRAIYVDDSSSSLVGANIFLLNTKLGAASDKNGYYQIKNIPLGKYVIECTYIGISTQIDTIELTDNKPELLKDFYLRFLKIPISMPDSIREYHNVFSSYKPEEILTIVIDSISKKYDSLYLTFTNKTKFPVYLIEDLLCFNTITVFIENEKGQNIDGNVINLGCDVGGENHLPQKNNLIKLNPFESLQLSFVIHEYSIKDYSSLNGKYYISLKYEIKDFKYLPGIYTNTEIDYYNIFREEMEILNQATRGVFFSKNEIVIER